MVKLRLRLCGIEFCMLRLIMINEMVVEGLKYGKVYCYSFIEELRLRMSLYY